MRTIVLHLQICAHEKNNEVLRWKQCGLISYIVQRPKEIKKEDKTTRLDNRYSKQEPLKKS